MLVSLCFLHFSNLHLLFLPPGGGAQRQADDGTGLAHEMEEPVRGWGLSGWANSDSRRDWWRSSSSSTSSGWVSGLKQPWLARQDSEGSTNGTDKQVCVRVVVCVCVLCAFSVPCNTLQCG